MTFSLFDAVQLLERTPDTLRALLTGLSASWTTADEGPATWNRRDVVAHLADLEGTQWVGRAQTVLKHGESRAFDPVNPLAFQETMRGRSLGELLDLFASRRRDNLHTLETLALDEVALAKAGAHPALGRVTLQQLLATWVVHDLTYLTQIARVLATRYRDAVGPWSGYLPILTSRGRRGS